jgi:DUF4097 and DUF4098 domain-containing protein YvlB
MATWDFPYSEPIDADISLAAGSISISATPTDVVTLRVEADGIFVGRGLDDEQINDEVDVAFSDGHLRVKQRSERGLLANVHKLRVEVGLPEQSRCRVQAASARITCEGVLGAVDFNTASGKINVATVTGQADVHAISGPIRIDQVGGRASLETASGQIQLGNVSGEAILRSVSGEISVGTAEASVTAKTASGRVRFANVSRGHADASTVSGSVEIGIAPGTGVYLDLSSLSGRVTSDLEPTAQDSDAQLSVHARTMSGGIRVASARPAEMAS